VTEAPGRWVEVASFAREEEARLLAGRLEAEGIPSRVYPESQASYYGPGTSARLGQPIRVLVPEHRTPQAGRVIDRLNRT
jgi:putative signal transducing protein/sporulation related protein